MVEVFLVFNHLFQLVQRRIGINYAEDGGDKADGVIYVRPGVKDLAIGSNQLCSSSYCC